MHAMLSVLTASHHTCLCLGQSLQAIFTAGGQVAWLNTTLRRGAAPGGGLL